MRTHLVLSVALVAAAMAAGCTGRFDVQQTEPFRIAIDGAPQSAQLSSGTTTVTGAGGTQARQEFHLSAPQAGANVTQVVVTVVVRPAAPPAPPPPPPPAGGNDTGPNATDPNATRPGASSAVTIKIIVEDRDTRQRLAEQLIQAPNATTQDIDVNIEGHHNVVIIAEAVEGSADVNISAKGKARQG